MGIDWTAIITALLLLGISFVIPALATVIGRFIAAKGDKVKQERRLLVAQEIDKMAESALNMILITNPHSSIIGRIDKIKDDLVARILADATIPVTKGEIAARVAGDAIFKALKAEIAKATISGGN